MGVAELGGIGVAMAMLCWVIWRLTGLLRDLLRPDHRKDGEEP